MKNLKGIKKLIRKKSQRYIQKLLRKESRLLIKESSINLLSNSGKESYIIFENASELIIKVNVKLKKDMGEEGDEQMQIFHLNNFLKSAPDKILKFLNLEKIDEDKTIGFK